MSLVVHEYFNLKVYDTHKRIHDANYGSVLFLKM